MKRIALVYAVATLGFATAASPAKSEFDVLSPIGKGPAQPFRASAIAGCDQEGSCVVQFGKAPKKSILIVETATCVSEALGDPNKDGAQVRSGRADIGVAFVPPTANTNFKVITNAYMPIRPGENVSILVGGKSGTVAVCNLTGRLLPEG